MKKNKAFLIAGTFAFFQGLMPMLGWIAVQTISKIFEGFTAFIPFIALLLLSYIGGKMIYEGIKKDCECEDCSVGLWGLVVQGVATSIDALSVGFEMTNDSLEQAIFRVIIIAIVTFIVCMFGVWAGKKFGNILSNKATVFGGIILVGIGIYIFIKGILKI